MPDYIVTFHWTAGTAIALVTRHMVAIDVSSGGAWGQTITLYYPAFVVGDSIESDGKYAGNPISGGAGWGWVQVGDYTKKTT